jgi:isopentenyl-diphosphate delta-isomerase
MQEEYVILVNEKDEVTGTMEKMQAHREGLLHRAFSVFIFNENGEVLLQQRALHKYHSPGLWTNTCCSHPRVGETVEQAAHRRLMEEMGFDCALSYLTSFIYKVEFEAGLYEHELDHVFKGLYTGEVSPNAEEVAAYQWFSWDQLLADTATHPERYTYWLRDILTRQLVYPV